MDHQRWLIENGLFNDLAKDTLYLYGSLVHKDVEAVHVVVDADAKRIKYTLYAPKSLAAKVQLYNGLVNAKSLIGMWRLRRLVRKEGSLNFNHILNKFVKDFCGPKWSAEMWLEDIDNYVDNLDDVRDGPNADSGEGSDRRLD
jgi:hypothetical protein